MPRSSNNPRTRRFTLLLTQAERRRVEQDAVAAGLSVSAYVRRLVFQAPRAIPATEDPRPCASARSATCL